MNPWDNMMTGHEFMRRDFENDEVEQAYRRGYKKGCEEGWRKAMHEAEHYYANRGGMGGGYNQRGDMGGYHERGNYSQRMPDYGMEERRGVPGTGPYGRWPR